MVIIDSWLQILFNLKAGITHLNLIQVEMKASSVLSLTWQIRANSGDTKGSATSPPHASAVLVIGPPLMAGFPFPAASSFWTVLLQSLL